MNFLSELVYPTSMHHTMVKVMYTNWKVNNVSILNVRTTYVVLSEKL